MLIKNVSSAALPLLYRNHVLIERVADGVYRATGFARYKGNPKYFTPGPFADIDAAIIACEQWGREHGILVVHVHEPA